MTAPDPHPTPTLDALALFLDLLRRGADVRRALVDRLRGRIEDDEYENALKLSVAADRILENGVLA